MSRTVTVLGLVFSFIMLAGLAQAGTWTNLVSGNASGNWGTAANWNPNTVPDGTDAVADFSTLNITAASTINNEAPHTVGTLLFGDTTPGNDWTLTNSTLTLATSSGVPTIDVSNGSVVTIGTALQGTQGLFKTGAGQLNLDQNLGANGIGSNTYSGGTYILAGTLSFGTANASYNTGLIGPGTVYLGDSSGSANAVLQTKYSSQNLNNNIIVQSGNTGIMQIKNNGGSLNLVGTVTLGSSGGNGKSLTFGRVDGATFISLYVTGCIQDPLNMTPGTAGTVTINHPNGVIFNGAANTYTGPTVIMGDSKLTANASTANNGGLPPLSAITVNGTLDMNDRSFTIGSLSGTGIVDRVVNGGSASTLTVGSNNTSTVFSGVIKNSQPSYPVSLVKIGSGTLTLSGRNTYSGLTLVNAGKLVGGTGGDCGKSSVFVATGATNGVKAMVYGAEGSFVCSNLTYMGNSGLDFDMATLPVNSGVAPLIINGDLTVTGVVQVSVSNGYWPATGTYPLVSYTGNLNGPGSCNLASLPAGMSATLVNNTGAKRLELDVTVIPAVAFPLSVWTNNVGGMWGTAANWSNGIPDGVDAVADFSTLNLAADAYVNNDAARTVGTLRFGDTTPSHNWKLTNSTLTLATSLGLPAIDVSNGSVVTIGTALQGTQGLFKTGAGQLNIDPNIGSSSTGSNTYSGGTYILAGTLMFGSGDYNTGLIGPGTVYLGDSSGSANAVLQTKYSNQNLDNNIIVQSGNTGIMQIKNNGGSLNLVGTVTLGSSGGNGKSLTLGRVDGGTFISLYVTGCIQDPLNMTPGTAGTVTINHPNGVIFNGAANTYTGPTVIMGDSKLTAKASTANNGGLPPLSAITVNGTLDMNDRSFTIGSLSGTGIVDRIVNGGSASTLTVGSNNTSTVFSGVIKNSQPSYPVSLVKIGSGALTLSGVNTYSGMTTISNGTLVVSNNLALSTNTVVLAGGGLGAAAGTWVITNVVNMVSNTTFDTTGTLALMGSVTNNGKLTKMGAGALWVNGSKTGTGDLIVSNGVFGCTGAVAGTVTNLATITAGDTSSIGTLTVTNLVMAENSAMVWNYYSASSQDTINVTGNLTLPNVATVNVSQVSSGRLPNPAVLFNFGTGLGLAATDTNLRNWVITGARSDTRAAVRGNQVQLLSTTGMILEIY